MDLFSMNAGKMAPLSDRMRPSSLDNFVGQEHIVGKNSILRRAVLADKLGSCIFYGPPGVGKTTLAHIIATNTKGAFAKLNAVSSGVADAKKVIDEAKDRLRMFNKRTYLLLDECHRWSKAQSDCVLGAIEDGSIVFIGSTTENPYVSMTRAIVSRCRIFEFKPLGNEDIIKHIEAAVEDKERGLGNMNLAVENEALRHIAKIAAGDMRSALNALELAALTTPPDASGTIRITKEVAEDSIQRKALSVDDGMYYDMLSAFCKSLRGSDPDAALYYAHRLLEAGCDPMLIFRRLIVHSAEDVGMADPNALTISVSAMTAFEKIGLPEGKIPLSEAIIYVATTEKSNSVVEAMGAAIDDAVNIKDDSVPEYLQDLNYKDKSTPRAEYKYPHDYGGYVEQQYLPDSIKDKRYYRPKQNGYEKNIIIKKESKK